MLAVFAEKKRKPTPGASPRRKWKSDTERMAAKRRIGRDISPPPIAADPEPTGSTAATK